MPTVSIPDDLTFSDLHLGRDTDGSVSFDWRAVEHVCQTSGLDVELFRDGPEDNVAALIVAWYHAHRQRGGAPDPVADDLIAETMAEELAGQTVSHQPGRA